MRTETEEIRDNLKYLSLLARDYPSQAAAASEIISTQALLKLPKGTEHFMSDLHGENEAFVHILNSASGVIREKVDIVLGDTVPEGTRAELATLIYYPNEKLPQLKERCADEEALEQWYSETLLRLIDICRLVSSKHTREHVRACLPSSCGYILDELLHAHFEDHDKDLYYGQIVGSIIENGRADKFIVRLCELIKRLAVDKLHIVGDLFDRGPRPDVILDLLMRHHDVDIQWGNHDVVWMGAAAGSPICICTVLKTTLAYHNHGMVEDCYGINLRHLQRMAEQFYGDDDLTIWMPHTDAARGPYTPGMLHRCAVMHKAITILMLKLECQVIDRNPDFEMQDRDFLRRINWEKGTVMVSGREYPMRDMSFPTVDPADPTALNSDEKVVLQKLVQSFRQSEKLQQHVEFLYAKGSVYHIENGNLLYHGAVPMTRKGTFAVERFEGHAYSGRALMDYCDERARRGYFAPEGSAARQSGQDFLWYLWCGKLSPLYGRSAMTTFERLYVEDASTHTEVKDPYYTWYNEEAVCRRILAEFGLPHRQRPCPRAGEEGREPHQGRRTPRGHRRRFLPRLPRKDRHRGLHAGLFQPHHVPAHPPALRERRKGRERESGHPLPEEHPRDGEPPHPCGGDGRGRDPAGEGPRPQTAGPGLSAGLDQGDPLRRQCVVRSGKCKIFLKIRDKTRG